MPNPQKKVKILPESFFFLPENLFLLREKFFLLPEKFLFLKKPGAGPYPKNAKSQKLIFEAHFHLISRKKSPGEFFFSPGEVFFFSRRNFDLKLSKKKHVFFSFFFKISPGEVYFSSPGEFFFSPGEKYILRENFFFLREKFHFKTEPKYTPNFDRFK